jgi:hypothetical protein
MIAKQKSNRTRKRKMARDKAGGLLEIVRGRSGKEKRVVRKR